LQKDEPHPKYEGGVIHSGNPHLLSAQSYHFDDSIQLPAGDSLFVVDANIALSKANSFIITTVNDQVSIDHSGNAMHQTTIKFTRTAAASRQFYGSSLYKAYVRVYMPSNSVLDKQDGWTPYDVGMTLGRKFWGAISMLLGDIPILFSAVDKFTFSFLRWTHVLLNDICQVLFS
jgi:hypothetical protein